MYVCDGHLKTNEAEYRIYPLCSAAMGNPGFIFWLNSKHWKSGYRYMSAAYSDSNREFLALYEVLNSVRAREG